MDHRPFEDWLLSEENLNPQQKRDLVAHLQTCQSCSAVAAVNRAFHSVRQAEPAAGFGNRFQVRLAAQRKTVRQRNVVGFSLLVLSVIGLFLGITWPVLKAAVESPVDLLGSWLSTLTNLWVSLQVLFRAGSVLFRVAPGFVPGYIWAILVFALTGWSVAWALSLRKFIRIKQGVQ
jgi:hypothetical protein